MYNVVPEAGGQGFVNIAPDKHSLYLRFPREIPGSPSTHAVLATVPEFADIVVIAWLFFTAIQYSLSPAICKVFFLVSYGKASKRTRRNWYFTRPQPSFFT